MMVVDLTRSEERQECRDDETDHLPAPASSAAWRGAPEHASTRRQHTWTYKWSWRRVRRQFDHVSSSKKLGERDIRVCTELELALHSHEHPKVASERAHESRTSHAGSWAHVKVAMMVDDPEVSIR